MLAACTLAALWLTACGTRDAFDASEMDRTRLMIARTSDSIQFSWESKKDRAYTLLYAERPDLPINEWQALPECTNLEGTGDVMTMEIDDPEKLRHYFRLRSNPR